MSLFPDEKTKEEKFRKYCHENNCDNTPFRLAAYLAGWNECEKHVRESASIGFDEWLEKTLKSAPTLEEAQELELLKDVLVFPWQACAIAKDKEISEKDKRIKELEEKFKAERFDVLYMDERVNKLESQLKERDEALIDLYEAYHNVKVPLDFVNVGRALHKHQSLINQIKEARK